MRFKWPWLDRIWCGLIVIAFLVMVPIWFILSAQRMGWSTVVIFVALALVYRYSDR